MFPKNLLNLMHESPMKMLVPLIILLLGSIFLGFIFRDLFLGVGSDFFKEQIFIFPTFNFFFESELISSFFKIFIFIFFIFFSILSYVFCFNFLTLKKLKDAKFFFFNLFFFFNSK
jgi:NADH:ubiquinone oxidoreductase subunit 5 (subunit L)/multisubunit Na+/H+ antiporter MnhA subunit